MERKKPIIFHQYPKVLKQDFEVFAKTCTHTHTHTLMYGYTPNACICMCMCMCVMYIQTHVLGLRFIARTPPVKN